MRRMPSWNISGGHGRDINVHPLQHRHLLRPPRRHLLRRLPPLRGGQIRRHRRRLRLHRLPRRHVLERALGVVRKWDVSSLNHCHCRCNWWRRADRCSMLLLAEAPPSGVGGFTIAPPCRLATISPSISRINASIFSHVSSDATPPSPRAACALRSRRYGLGVGRSNHCVPRANSITRARARDWISSRALFGGHRGSFGAASAPSFAGHPSANSSCCPPRCSYDGGRGDGRSCPCARNCCFSAFPGAR